MNKKFFSAVLMGALLLGGTFVSCQDYDDDIENLQAQIDGLKGLQSDVTSLKADLSNVQASCQTNINQAINGLKDGDVKKALQDAASAKELAEKADKAAKDITGLSAEDIKLLAWVKENAEKVAMTADVTKQLDDLEKKLKTSSSSDADGLRAEFDEIKKAAGALVGKRLTSLVFAPKAYINGIEAIKFVDLQYRDWSKDSTKWLADAPAAKTTTKVEDYGTVAEYLVSPAGVTLEGIEELKFRTQYNVTNTRAAAKTLELSIVNSKIEDGVLVLDLKKNNFVLADAKTGANVEMNDTVLVAGTAAAPDTASVVSGVSLAKESMTIVALEAVLKDAVKTEAEKGMDVSVFSDWARVQEGVEIPRIHYAKAKTCGSKADETDNSHFWAFSKIYTDAKKKTAAEYTVAKANVADYSISQVYNEPLDLMSIVTVCTNEGTRIDNYAKYGLDFEFHLLDYKVKNQGVTADATNQKLFAKLEGTTLTSTSETGLENNRNAVGRTPVVQIVLKDTKADAVVDVRYVKILWATDAPTALVWPYDMKAVLGFECADKYDSIWVGETYLNKLYAEIVAGGMDKTQFRAKYPTLSPVYALDKDVVIDDELMEAVVNGGEAKLTKIGKANWKEDEGGSDKTQNIVVNFTGINPHIWDGKTDKGQAPEADFEQNGFFMFISADGLSRIFVPVKINVKAGVYYSQYAQEQWNTGSNTVTGTESPAADKLRTINPILYSDATYGQGKGSGIEATQMLGSITMGYRYEGKAPKSTKELARYAYAEGTLQAALVADKKNPMTNPEAESAIHFDATRLSSLPTLTKNDSVVGAVNPSTDLTGDDVHKDFIWFVYKASATKEILAYGIPNYKDATKKDITDLNTPAVLKGSVGAVIDNDSIYLVDSLKLTATGTYGMKSLPTEAALLLVGQSVPVIVNAKHCDEIAFDKYYFNFVKPLTFNETGKTITLKDVTNEGDSAVVDLEEYVQLKENFGQNASRIYLFNIPATQNDTTKNNTLINWYDIKVAAGDTTWFNTTNALTSLRLDGKQDATCETPLADILGKDQKNQAYDITIEQRSIQKYKDKIISDGKPVYKDDGSGEIEQIPDGAPVTKYVVKFHNTNGNGLAPGESFKIDIPVTVDTKWQKPLVGYIHVVIKNGYDK